MESTGSTLILNFLKELDEAESEKERNTKVNTWVADASTDNAKLALSMAKDLIETLKDTELSATPFVSMEINFSWEMIKKYLAMLLALITISGKVPSCTSEASQKSNKGESEAPSSSSFSRAGSGIGKDLPLFISQRQFLSRNHDGASKMSTSGEGAASNRSSNNDIAMQEIRFTQLGKISTDFFTVESDKVIKSIEMGEFNKELGKSGVESVLGKIKMPQEKGLDSMEWSSDLADYYNIAMPALSTFLFKNAPSSFLRFACNGLPRQATEEGLQIRFISFAANIEGASPDAKDNVNSEAFKEHVVTWLLMITLPEDVVLEGWGQAKTYAVKVYGENLNKCNSFNDMYEFFKPLFQSVSRLALKLFEGIPDDAEFIQNVQSIMEGDKLARFDPLFGFRMIAFSYSKSQRSGGEKQLEHLYTKMVNAIKAPHTTFLSAPYMNNVQKMITSYMTAVRNQDVPPEAVTSQHTIMKILVEHWGGVLETESGKFGGNDRELRIHQERYHDVVRTLSKYELKWGNLVPLVASWDASARDPNAAILAPFKKVDKGTKRELPENSSQVMSAVKKLRATVNSLVKGKGDWFCSICQFRNWATRETCKQCLATKSEGGVAQSEGGGSAGKAANLDDWDCLRCKLSNFSVRKKCRGCGISRSEAGGSAVGAAQGGKTQQMGAAQGGKAQQDTAQGGKAQQDRGIPQRHNAMCIKGCGFSCKSSEMPSAQYCSTGESTNSSASTGCCRCH